MRCMILGLRIDIDQASQGLYRQTSTHWGQAIMQFARSLIFSDGCGRFEQNITGIETFSHLHGRDPTLGLTPYNGPVDWSRC